MMMRCNFVWILCVCVLVLARPLPSAAQENPRLDAFAQINRARLTNGLAPFAASPLLEKAAQRHSDDMARNNFLGDAGSDDSNAKDRMTQAGYIAWSNDKVIWGENLYADIGEFSAVLNFILTDPSQARILLNPRYREVGLGVSVGENGKSYWTLLYGAQPNVLPIFINDGASVTNNATVALRLSQEDAVSGGESNNVIGRALEVRIGNSPAGTGASWQQWQPLLEYKFDTVPGIKTIYVQYRDGAGRVANAAASIRYDPNASSLDTIQPLGPGDIVSNATPTVIVTLTPEPTLTRVAPVDSQSTSAASEGTPTAVVIGGPLVSEPTATPQPLQPAPVAKATQTAPANLERIPTAFVIDLAATNAAQFAALANETRAVEPLVATIRAPSTDATLVFVPRNTLARVEVPLPTWLLPAYAVLQTAVIVLGLYAFFKRK